LARTGGSRKGIGGPRTPEGRARALMNLRPFQLQKQLQEKEEGKRAHLYHGRDRHGVFGINLLQPQTRELAEQIADILRGDTLAYIRPVDEVAVGLLAVALRRIRQAEAYLDKVGSLTNKKGQIRPVAELLVKLLKEAREYCSALGLTPQSRARLGLNIARAGTDLAELLAETEREVATVDPAGGENAGLAEGPHEVR